MPVQSLANVATFTQVAAAGGFAQGAARLGMSASAASKAVSRLEAELGVKLLHRTTRALSLTPEGERFLEGARRLLEEFDLLTAEVSDRSGPPRGRLVISAPTAFGRLWLTRRVAAFLRRFPEIEVELVFDDRLVDLAADGADVALRVGPLGDSPNLVARKLGETPVFTLASPDYLARRGRPESVDDLERHDILHYRLPTTGRVLPFWFSGADGPERRRFAPALVVNSPDALAVAAAAGAGVAQLGAVVARPALAAGALEEVLAERRHRSLPISLLWLDRRLVSPRIRAFVDFVAADPFDPEALGEPIDDDPSGGS